MLAKNLSQMNIIFAFSFLVKNTWRKHRKLLTYLTETKQGKQIYIQLQFEALFHFK